MKKVFLFLLMVVIWSVVHSSDVEAVADTSRENSSNRIRSEILEGKKRLNSAERYKVSRMKPPKKPTSLRTRRPFPSPHKDEITFYGTYVGSSFDPNDRATAVQVQIASDAKMKHLIWDSGKRLITDAVKSNQTVRFTYDGDLLPFDGAVYYYRMKIWGGNGVEGEWSFVNDLTRFKMYQADRSRKILNMYIPDVPDLLRVNRKPVDKKVVGIPVFSARFKDKDGGDEAVFYELEVNLDQEFNQVPVWSSGKVRFENPVKRTEQTPDLPYGGRNLLSDGKTRYHWRIRFWDKDDKVSLWSNLGLFMMKKLSEP